MKASSLVVKLDAGHGAEDPGVVDQKRNVLEKDANLKTVLTLAYLLQQQGIKTVLSRTTDIRPSYADRVKNENQTLLIALHYNMVGSYPCFYYKHGSTESHSIATTLSITAGINANRVWDTSTEARWGRLYIDDSTGPAVLWEVDAIDQYEDLPAYRIQKCLQIVKGLKAFYDIK